MVCLMVRSCANSSNSTHNIGSMPAAQNRTENWEGIPYHRVEAPRQPGPKTPIRDPSELRGGSATTADAAAGTRIIRGGSARTIQAQPASVRRHSALTVERAPAPAVPRPSALSVPRPSADMAIENAASTELSNSSSSRRSGRRSVDALDASEIAAASNSSSTSAGRGTIGELVPRVARREINDADAADEAENQSPAPESVADATKVKSDAKPVEAQPTLVPVPSRPTTALAVISSSARADKDEEPQSATDVGVPSSTLSAPSPTASPAYTTPVDPVNRPVPVAGVPSHPYAASTPNSTPSLPVAHRSGPPASAFGPSAITTETQGAPIGSGVAAGEVASYRRPGTSVSHPDLRPEGQYELIPSMKPMSTNGQAVEISAAPSGTVDTRPLQNSASVTTQPIDIQRSPATVSTGAPNRSQDNFATSTLQTRNNRMRSEYDLNGPQSGGAAAASELPGIRVVTNGPGEIMIRQTNEYEIRVENRGSIDAEGVLVRAVVPDWAELRGQNATQGSVDTQTQGSTERLVWTIDQLPAGASERMMVRLKAARSGTYDLDVDWTLVPQKSVARVHVHEPKLDLNIDGPDEVIFGQSQTYKVRVLNPGDGTAPNVVFTLSPNSATPQTQQIGDIPAGKEAQFDVELTAQDLGDLKIHGLASGDLELRAESSKTIRVAAAKLEAMLTGPELKYQNTESMYNLQVQNTGAATSEKIVATLRLPVGVKYLGGIEEAELRGHTLRWEITALAPKAIRNYQFRCDMTTTGEHLFAFDCKGTAAGNADVTIATRVESIADLVLSISDPVAPAPIGTDVIYEIVVRNRGSKEATDIRTVAQFSHGIEPRRIEGQSGEVVTGQVLFDPIPRIGPGQEVRMRVVAQAEKAGHHRFRTEVHSGDTVLVAEEATHYMSPTSERVSRRSTDEESR